MIDKDLEGFFFFFKQTNEKGEYKMLLTRKGRSISMRVCFLRNRSYRNEATGVSFRNSYAKGQRRN